MAQEKIKKQSWIKQLATLSARYLRVIASDKYYLGLLAAIPVLVGAICYATAGELGLGPGLPNKSGVVSNPIAEGEEDYGVGFNVPLGVQTAVRWGAIAVTQPTSGLENLDNMPPATVDSAPNLNVPLEEIAKP
jgi:hypothetical protein